MRKKDERMNEEGAYILTQSPVLILMLSSSKGEKWQTQSLTERQVGKAIPIKNGEEIRIRGRRDTRIGQE